MGDRTTCYLTIKGLLYEGHMDEIVQCLKDNRAEVNSLEKHDTLAEAMRAGEHQFTLYEVNYAQMPDDLSDMLSEAGLFYAWSWESGGDFGEGMNLYDPFTKAYMEIDLSNGRIMIPLEKTRDLEYVTKIEAWAELTNIKGFATYKSNHDLLRIKSEDKVDARFFDLHSERAVDA